MRASPWRGPLECYQACTRKVSAGGAGHSGWIEKKLVRQLDDQIGC